MAFDYAKNGGTLVVWRLDLLSRSLKDLIEMVNLLDKKRIGLKRIHETIDTSSSSGKHIFHFFERWLNSNATSSVKERKKGYRQLEQWGAMEVGLNHLILKNVFSNKAV